MSHQRPVRIANHHGYRFKRVGIDEFVGSIPIPQIIPLSSYLNSRFSQKSKTTNEKLELLFQSIKSLSKSNDELRGTVESQNSLLEALVSYLLVPTSVY